MNDYKITSFVDGIFRVETEQCIYNIKCNECNNETTLIGISLTDGSPSELKIPKILPSGHTIDRIVSHMGFGGCIFPRQLDKLIIDDNIRKIDCQAFIYAKANKIKWPSNCLTIPEACFKSNAFIEHIEGTDNVTQVGKSAFEATWIKDFVWPKNCLEIPDKCFMDSYIEAINGIESVRSIGYRAFSNTSLKYLDMSYMPFCYFGDEAFSCNGNIVVKFPYYTTKEQRVATGYTGPVSF